MVTNTYFEMFALCILLILPFIYETSHTFRYYFKFFVYYAICNISSLILIPYFMVFRPFEIRNLVTASYFLMPTSSIIGLKWILRGREILEENEPCIIVSNHQSSIDILGMMHLWPVMQKCTVVAKKEVLYAFPFGLGAWLCGLVFIDRMNSEKSKEKMNKSTEFLKENKAKLWVFPEGTRRITNEIHSFKKGAFHTAINAQLPIMPVVFTSYTTFLNDKTKHFSGGDIIVEALPKISTEGLTSDDVLDLMDRVRNSMIQAFNANTKEVETNAKIAFNLKEAKNNSINKTIIQNLEKQPNNMYNIDATTVKAQ